MNPTSKFLRSLHYQRQETNLEAWMIGSLVRRGHFNCRAVAAIKRSWSSGMSVIEDAAERVFAFSEAARIFGKHRAYSSNAFNPYLPLVQVKPSSMPKSTKFS